MGVNIIGGVAFILIIVALYAAFLYAPTEAFQGNVQRIFYFHLPSALMAFLAFSVVCVSSIFYLWRKERKWDIVAAASAELGVLFCSLVLITGPIWAKPIWGVWWTWDARLTTTLILWLIYVAYLMLRAYGGDYSQSTRFAAVLGIIGFLDVPLIHMSVNWWRTLHPEAVFFNRKGIGIGLEPSMKMTLYLSLTAFTLLYIFLLAKRISLEVAKDELEQLKDAMGG
ncbi:MAG: cytochrome c biogenesis protein CcsA [Candidatus Latescibacteria bacterium]|nr:cytochrome c biogenesis protein CcsA [Candidatus Latescibacterota bacterium]